MTWFFYLVAAGLGLIWGSFFNVVIYRTPREEGLGQRSRCPECGYTIRWYDNIPLVSFAYLRGRCRNCGRPISWMYPAVEASTALLFVLCYWWSINVVPGLLGIEAQKPFVPELIIAILLVSVGVVVAVVDVRHGIVPDRVVFPGMVLMLSAVLGLAFYREQPVRIASSLGLAFGSSAFFAAVSIAYGAVRMKGREPLQPSDYSMALPGEDRHTERAPGESVVSVRTAWVMLGIGAVLLAGALSLAIPLYQRDSYGAAVSIAVGLAGGFLLLAAGLLIDALTAGEDLDDVEEVPTGMGMGDVKLLFFTGLALGYFNWALIVVELLVASVLGLVVGLLVMGLNRKEAIPFGPFLAAGAVVALFWGQQLIDVVTKLYR
ncbi:MAG: prepilin peptidase [Actinomycetota bacterium]